MVRLFKSEIYVHLIFDQILGDKKCDRLYGIWCTYKRRMLEEINGDDTIKSRLKYNMHFHCILILSWHIS